MHLLDCKFSSISPVFVQVIPFSNHAIRLSHLKTRKGRRSFSFILRCIQQFVADRVRTFALFTLTLTIIQDKDPLQDTNTSIRGVSREPSRIEFIPVGHISLAPKNPYLEKVDLDLPSEHVYWIKTFYVSQALRNQRLGTAAMKAAEAMAINEPLCARTLALDTATREDQMREDIAKAFYGGIPKVSCLALLIMNRVIKPLQVMNQDWYEKMGYRPLKTVKGLYTSPDRNGVVWDLSTIFMRKDIY